jgi:hydrogenase maturation protease
MLEGRLPADVAIIARNGDMLSLLDDWEGCEAVVCIDAAAPSGTPGRVHCLDLGATDLPPPASLATCHGVGLDHVIALGRALGRAPGRIVIYAIEGVSFDVGAPLNPAVLAALGPALDAIVANVARLSCSGPASATVR